MQSTRGDRRTAATDSEAPTRLDLGRALEGLLRLSCNGAFSIEADPEETEAVRAAYRCLMRLPPAELAAIPLRLPAEEIREVLDDRGDLPLEHVQCADHG